MVEGGAASDFLEQMRMTNQNIGRKETGIKCSHQQLEKFGIGREQFEKQAAQTKAFNETDDGDESSIGIGALRQLLNQKRAKPAKNLPRAWGNVKGNDSSRACTSEDVSNSSSAMARNAFSVPCSCKKVCFAP